MNSKRVAVPGLGIFCSIGGNVGEFLHSLQRAAQALDRSLFLVPSKYPSKIGAEIRDYQPEDFFSKKGLRRLSRTDQFALIAAEEAVRNSAPAFESPRRGWSLSAPLPADVRSQTYHQGDSRSREIQTVLAALLSSPVSQRTGLRNGLGSEGRG